ncbi:MAG: hypothetical protein ABL996_09145 [Micropepsaceae bacterium]
MNWKMAGMASTALVAVALSGVTAVAGANKFTGNVSLAVGQSFEDDDLGGSVFDDSFTSITGDANVNVAFSNNINLQLNFIGVGSFADDGGEAFSLDRQAGFQGAAHLYWRDSDRGAIGIFGGAGISSGPEIIFEEVSAEYYFAGVEGQYYWKNFTFGLAGGYLDSSSDDSFSSRDDLFLNSAWFANAEVRWYATPKVALSANVGYISGEAAFDNADVDVLHWGAKAEYWPEEKEPLSLWVGYEGRDTNADFGVGSEVDKQVHTVKIGLTIHFGVDEGNSQAQDRHGPAFNQMDYGAIVVGG